jgi:hypothetical protein
MNCTCRDECSALRLSASLSAIAFCAARTAADTGRDCDDEGGRGKDDEEDDMEEEEADGGAKEEDAVAWLDAVAVVGRLPARLPVRLPACCGGARADACALLLPLPLALARERADACRLLLPLTLPVPLAPPPPAAAANDERASASDWASTRSATRVTAANDECDWRDSATDASSEREASDTSERIKCASVVRNKNGRIEHKEQREIQSTLKAAAQNVHTNSNPNQNRTNNTACH